MNKICFGVILLFTLLTSCTAEEDYDILLKNEESIKTYYAYVSENSQEKSEYNVLVIGNSLSRDAFSYVPAIMNDVCNEKTFEVDILYKSGKALSDHWNSIKNEVSDNTLDSYDVYNSKWQLHTNVLAKNYITSKEWDLVVLQEKSVTA